MRDLEKNHFDFNQALDIEYLKIEDDKKQRPNNSTYMEFDSKYPQKSFDDSLKDKPYLGEWPDTEFKKGIKEHDFEDSDDSISLDQDYYSPKKGQLDL